MISDPQALDLVLRRARRGQGQTGDNPSVGCLILCPQNQVIALSHTAAGGRPHAEIEALRQAGAAASGAIAYVTLEPCAHQGRSGPCASALADAGIARVVIGTKDANPEVSGKGAAILEAAGVEVTWANHAASARHHLGFNRRMDGGKPHTLMKIATTADGAMAYADGEERLKITGPEVQRQVHLLRARSEMLITGPGTMRTDTPQLNVRLPGYAGSHPEIKVWSRQDRLENLQANQVMIEAGPTLSSALFPEIDELHWYRNQTVLGRKGVRPDFLTADPLDFSRQWPKFTLISRRTYGQDVREIWRR